MCSRGGVEEAYPLSRFVAQLPSRAQEQSRQGITPGQRSPGACPDAGGLAQQAQAGPPVMVVRNPARLHGPPHGPGGQGKVRLLAVPSLSARVPGQPGAAGGKEPR